MPTSPALRPALALAVTALVLSAAAPVAHAGVDPEPAEDAGRSVSQCLTGRFCVWSGAGYSGAFWSTQAVGLVDSAVGTARSVWNRTGVDVLVYTGSGGGGTFTCWQVGAQTSSTTTPSGSVRTMGPTTC